MFHFFANKKISFDQLTHGSHRWLALVGLSHCNTLQGIPGLADLTGAISIRVVNRLLTLPLRVTRDPGVMVPSPLGNHNLSITCDLLICTPSLSGILPIAKRVHSPNMFTITYRPPGDVFVHYMNAQGQHIEVPVLVEGNHASTFVVHPEFGAVSNRRFNDLPALIDALVDELHMIET